MPNYYVNMRAQSNGDHEVHRADYCPTPAAPHNRRDLGWHAACYGAVREAKKIYRTANGCRNCSPEWHTT